MYPELLSLLSARQAAFLDDLRVLVGLDSSSYDREDVNRVVDWLAARLRAAGFTVERFSHPNAGDDLLATKHGRGSRNLMLLGHSDTVFPHGTAAQRPMSFAGDKILGPGVCDMKSGLLTGVYAAEALDALGVDSYGTLRMVVVSDEEIDHRHSIPLLQRISRLSDVGLTLEAARQNGDIVVARKGVRAWTAEAFGHAAHSGVEPEKGHNAILAMARLIDALEAVNDPARGISLNVGQVEGGRLRNVVPDHAKIMFETRAFTPADLDRASETVTRLLAQPLVPGVTFQVEVEDGIPPMPLTPAVERLAALAQRCAERLGFTVKGAQTGGAADCAFVAAEGVPVLDGLGPIGGLDHGPDEYILRSSIVPRLALLTALIAEIATNTGEVNPM